MEKMLILGGLRSLKNQRPGEKGGGGFKGGFKRKRYLFNYPDPGQGSSPGGTLAGRKRKGIFAKGLVLCILC